MGRAVVYQLLASDAELVGLGLPEGNIYASSAVDTPASWPFLILRWQERDVAHTDPELGDVGGEWLLQLWAHDRGQDYMRIDALLERGRQLITGAAQYTAAGETLVAARWAGDSPDLYDDGFRTVTKHADFQVVSR